MSFLRRRRRVLVAIALVLLALLILRPGVNGLRRRIVSSVSASLGREVEVQWVKLRVLPQPGFDLINFTVHDDPGFSVEPMLRAQEVTAVLRLRSLLRGRLEVGRLTLKEPSFNLVRGENGHWNVESLLNRAAHTQIAPTRNTRPERRPIFPYIESDDGRINFKIGLEKKAYSLTDADFALWLESDDQWGMRLTAQPLRTDFNLNDTGLLHLNGTWQRSATLSDTPVKLTFRWEGAQLGELAKLLYGRDMGWRGALLVSAELAGTPADLKIAVRSSISNFRRFDIVTEQSLRLSANCEARYSSIDRAVSDLTCTSPVGDGLLSVRGGIVAPTGPQIYDLRFSAEDVPVQAVVNLARRVKQDLPEDLSATGTMTGSVVLKGSSVARERFRCSGSGQMTRVSIRSGSQASEIVLGTVPFRVDRVSLAGSRAARDIQAENRLEVGPFVVALGKQSLVTVQGYAAQSGYNFLARGESSLQRLWQAARVLGLKVPSVVADGDTNFDFALEGKWSGFAAPRPTGTAQLKGVLARIPGVGGPVTVRSANVVLDEETVHAYNINASAAGSIWRGSISVPRPCHLLSGCAVHFDLHADLVAADRLHQWLSPGSRKQPWYHIVGGTPGPSLISVLKADGTLAADRVQMRGVVASRVNCQLNVHDGTLRLSSLSAELLGGRHRGSWTGNLRVNPPEFSGTGKFEHVNLARLAEAMHDDWISGTSSGVYELSASGKTAKDWIASAAGTLRFEMRDGSLPHIIFPASATPLRVHRFTGNLLVRSGNFHLEQAKLDDGAGTFEVSGTASPGQKLQMRLARAGSGFLIDGTLSAPHIVAVSSADTRASLKP